MTDHNLHKYHIKGTPFLSSYMKFTSKTWKNNYYLNVRKRIHIFREYSDGFIDFNKSKNDNIDETIHSIYSKLDNMKRKYIMNDLMKELTGKLFRVMNKTSP